jgi:hypothetical protein
MNDHESIHAIGQPQAEPRTRTRAQAKITVQSSEATPYDQTASPALMEIRLSKRSPEILMANQRSGLYRSCATIILPASSVCNDSAENCADARAPS